MVSFHDHRGEEVPHLLINGKGSEVVTMLHMGLGRIQNPISLNVEEILITYPSVFMPQFWDDFVDSFLCGRGNRALIMHIGSFNASSEPLVGFRPRMESDRSCLGGRCGIEKRVCGAGTNYNIGCSSNPYPKNVKLGR